MKQKSFEKVIELYEQEKSKKFKFNKLILEETKKNLDFIKNRQKY